MSTPFAPFNPGKKRDANKSRRLNRRIPVRLIIPNIVTLLALCAGLTAMRLAMENNWEYAIAAIVFAAILDGLDGRVARLLKGTSRFGAELDSLADFANFGVAPALILYYWILHNVQPLGWIAVLIFAICTTLRLARFNISLDEPKKGDWQSNFFVGVPAPAGAITVLLPLYLWVLGYFPIWSTTELVVLVYTILIGLLMVSRFPTFSGKKLQTRIRRDLVLPLFVLVVMLAALFVSYPFQMLALTTGLYLVLLPFSYRSWKHSRDRQKGNEETD